MICTGTLILYTSDIYVRLVPDADFIIAHRKRLYDHIHALDVVRLSAKLAGPTTELQAPTSEAEREERTQTMLVRSPVEQLQACE